MDAAPPRIVVVPDIHADLDKARECLALAGVIDAAGNWAARPPGTVVVQLGDQVDGKPRGASPPREHVCGDSLKRDLDVIRFFNALHKSAAAAGGAVYSLLGNHELMNAAGAYDYADDDGCPECRRRRGETFAPGMPGARLLACTRAAVLCLGGFVFVHAGVLMEHVRALDGDLTRLNDVAFRFLMGSGVTEAESELLFGSDGPFFTRAYSPQAPDRARLELMSAGLGARAVVSGHNAHPAGVTVMSGASPGGTKAVVFDPGVSRAIYSAPAAALEIFPKPNGDWSLKRL